MKNIDHRFKFAKRLLVHVYVFIVAMIGTGIVSSSPGICIMELQKGQVPCSGRQTITRRKNANSESECCLDMRGIAYAIEISENGSGCFDCQEIMATEYKWLPPPPCDKRNCYYIPQQYIWFPLYIGNRRIHCIGHSYKNVLHCRRNKTLCSLPEPATDPVYCFQHRYHKLCKNSSGCPASSLHSELARDVRDCCVVRGGAGYARHIDRWHIDDAKLHECTPCPDNPSFDATWSEWTPCAPSSRCSRERTMQIPYLRNIPIFWCMETFTMEEVKVEVVETETSLNPRTQKENLAATEPAIMEDPPTQRQNLNCPTMDNLTSEFMNMEQTDLITVTPTVIAVIILVVFVTILTLAIALGYLYIQKRTQARSLSETRLKLKMVSKTDDESQDGYLIPSNAYSATPEMRPRLATPPSVEAEHVYADVRYAVPRHRPVDTPPSPTYIEMK